MIEDIHACLDALKLRKMREIVQEELKTAQGKKTSYSAFLLELLRQEHEDKRRRSIQSRIRQASLPELWTLDISLQYTDLHQQKTASGTCRT